MTIYWMSSVLGDMETLVPLVEGPQKSVIVLSKKQQGCSTSVRFGGICMKNGNLC